MIETIAIYGAAILGIPIAIWLLVSCSEWMHVPYNDLSKDNIFKLPVITFEYIIYKLKLLTPLQKEIRDEERTIKQLEAQKADMERLADLKRKREALFEEVGDKHAERVGDHSEERVRVTVDGYQIPYIFPGKESANDYVERFHPKAKEIEMRGKFTL